MLTNRFLYRFILLIIAVSLILEYRSTAHGAEQMFEITEQYETINKEEDESFRFPPTQERDGRKYIRNRINTKVLKEVPLPRDIITLEGEGFTGEPNNHKPPDMIEQEGKVYQLKECVLIDTFVEERTKDITAVTPYKGVEFIDTLPADGSVEAVDEDTMQMVTVNLPYKSHTEVQRYWDNSFSFPFTVVSYDAKTYLLGDVEIPSDAELISYGKEFLQYLGLPKEYYRILEIHWNGDIYESNEELRRDAAAYGQKLVKDIDVTYAGSVSFPGIQAQAYNGVYELLPKKGETNTMYTVETTATYIQDMADTEQLKHSFWKKTFEWIKTHMLGFTICVTFFLVLFLLLFLYLKAKRKKKERNQFIMHDR